MHRITLVLAAALLPALPAPAQQSTPRPMAARHEAAPAVRAVRLSGSGTIDIDGKLGEPAWQAANQTAAFTQRDPEEGASVSQSTEARILYDSEALYQGVRL